MDEQEKEYAICSDCGEPFPVDEMFEDDDGGYICWKDKQKADNRIIHCYDF